MSVRLGCLLSALVAIVGLAQPAAAQCVKCNYLIQDCSWGPWIDGYNKCKTVDGDCVQSVPCSITLRQDLNGGAILDPSQLKSIKDQHQLRSLMATASLDTAAIARLEAWIEIRTSLRTCRGLRATTTATLSSTTKRAPVIAALAL